MLRPLQLRRAALSLATLLAGAALALHFPRLAAALPHLDHLTGWALLALCLLLTAYGARKKLPSLPLFSSRAWLQFHAYAGLLAALLFAYHIRLDLPRGPFHLALAALFLAVTLTGLLGWWLGRLIPRRLTTTGGEVPFERIPLVRRELRLRADALALAAIPEARDTTLADIYARHLAPALAAPPRLLPHLLASPRELNDRLALLAASVRFLSPPEKTRADELGELVRARHVLDFHYANQLLLKAWLFVHVPLTYGLLLFTALHVVLVLAFSGGAR